MYEGGSTLGTFIQNLTPFNGEIQVWKIPNANDKTNVRLIYTTVQL
jgi:hypothetical protein